MAHLEPSVELTGGPWYTDNELDTEFIKLLCSACLRYVRERVCYTSSRLILANPILANPITCRHSQNTGMMTAVSPPRSLCTQYPLVLPTRTPKKYFHF